jgi:hypothetical protein
MYIIWPGTPRHISDAQIETWFNDAVANGVIMPDEWPNTALDHAMALEDIGFITLGKEP